ncbi:hypothetical protein GCM10009109_21830 [Marinobacterium sediminicola]
MLMGDFEHKPGVKEVNLVSRKMRLVDVKAQAENALVEAVRQLFGMDRVVFDAPNATLYFDYDATHCSLDKVEGVIRNMGAKFDTGWWSRFKRSYYRFVDQNMKDNEAHEPHCCNKVPRK